MGQQKRTVKAKGWSYKAGERGKNCVHCTNGGATVTGSVISMSPVSDDANHSG